MRPDGALDAKNDARLCRRAVSGRESARARRFPNTTSFRGGMETMVKKAGLRKAVAAGDIDSLDATLAYGHTKDAW